MTDTRFPEKSKVAPTAALDPFSAILAPLLDAKFAEFAEEMAEIVAARPVPGLLDPAGLAQWLGVTTPTIAKMRADGLPYLRVGECYRYDLAEVRAWLTARREGGR